MNPIAVRCRSLLLLGVFLLGSLGVPLADGVVYHLAGKDPCAGLTHVEAQGSTHHADRCTLAQPTAPQQTAAGSSESTRVSLPAPTRMAASTTWTAPRSTVHRLQHSRAPPA